MAFKIDEMVGKTYKNWQVIERDFTRNNHAKYVKCKCLVCK